MLVNRMIRKTLLVVSKSNFFADINECAITIDPCSTHGTCLNLQNRYACQCDAGWTGETCAININDCDPNPCVHGACTDAVNDFSCACQPGWNGKECDNGECIHTSKCGV